MPPAFTGMPLADAHHAGSAAGSSSSGLDDGAELGGALGAEAQAGSGTDIGIDTDADSGLVPEAGCVGANWLARSAGSSRC